MTAQSIIAIKAYPVEFTSKLIEKSHIAKICSEIRSTKRKSFRHGVLIFCTLVINVIFTRQKMRGTFLLLA